MSLTVIKRTEGTRSSALTNCEVLRDSPVLELTWFPLQATNNKGKEKVYSAERFLIATGERPRYLGIPGDKEYCISRWESRLTGCPACPVLGQERILCLVLALEIGRNKGLTTS